MEFGLQKCGVLITKRRKVFKSERIRMTDKEYCGMWIKVFWNFGGRWYKV